MARPPKLSTEEKKSRRQASWRKWHTANREVLLAKARGRYAINKEAEKNRHKIWASQNLEHLRKYNKERYKTNPSGKITRARKWREENPGYAAFASKRWVRNNPEKARDSWRRIGQLRRMAPGNFTNQDISDIRRLQRNRCAYCREKLVRKREHIDHIVPLSKKGTHNRSNIQLLCIVCNKRKAAKDAIEFSRSMGMLL